MRREETQDFLVRGSRDTYTCGRERGIHPTPESRSPGWLTWICRLMIGKDPEILILSPTSRLPEIRTRGRGQGEAGHDDDDAG